MDEKAAKGAYETRKTQILSGFEANPSSHITFLIRDAIPGEVV